MFRLEETGPEIIGNSVRFRIYLPSIDNNFSVKVYVINKKDQFDPGVRADSHDLSLERENPSGDDKWGEVNKNRWCSKTITMDPGTYLYRFEISGPKRENLNKLNLNFEDPCAPQPSKETRVRSLFFGDPCARETDAGVFSVFRIPDPAEISPPWKWEDDGFQVPELNDLIIYELNIAEFAGTFSGVADRIPYLLSLGVNAIELMPINSIAEPTQWGYMPIFHFAPEERFGGPDGLRLLVKECHRNEIAVIIDMVYAHVDRMFPYQIGYERFFDLWYNNPCFNANGQYQAPNPIVCAYENFGKKVDWRMLSTQEFFAAVNAFWLREYHVDGFRYDHVNGYLDKKPIETNGCVDWYSHENRPTFKSLQNLSKTTYQDSKRYKRFMSGSGSRIIQIAEDLGESAYQLSPKNDSAINGCWEKSLAIIAQNMVKSDVLLSDISKELLLKDERFDKQGYTGTKSLGEDSIAALVVQYVESHDEPRLLYLLQNKEVCRDSGFEYRNGLDSQPWCKLQPYAIALMTSVGIPMLWAGQEFAENTGLASGGQVRVRGLRPLHWDYFYNAASFPVPIPEKSTVLPLVTLYRTLGKLRRKQNYQEQARQDHPALRGPRENAKQEYCNEIERILVYRRSMRNEILIIALNFSDQDKQVCIPFGHTGIWIDILEEEFKNSDHPYFVKVEDPVSWKSVSVPGNFGRIFRFIT